MELRLTLYVVAVVIAVTASLAAMADQSGRLVGVHEIPPFVLERIALPPGATADRVRDAAPPDVHRTAAVDG